MKDGNFEIGDKVRFVDNELNRAEISKSARNATLEVAGYVSANRIGLRELECYYYHGRFELVPQYQVGDWVEMNVYANHQGTIKEIFNSGMAELFGTRIHRTNPTFTITGLSGEFNFSCISRKLSPAEVVISIGCLKGRIEAHNERVFRLYYSELEYSLIAFDALDNTMLILVESLLTNQNKENALDWIEKNGGQDA
jgi:hypothetical protein